MAILRHNVLVYLEDFHGDALNCSPISCNVSCERTYCVCLLEICPPIDVLLISKVLNQWGSIF